MDKQASSESAGFGAEHQDTLARTKDKATKILGSAIGHAVTLGLWRMRHDEAIQKAVHLEGVAESEAAKALELEEVCCPSSMPSVVHQQCLGLSSTVLDTELLIWD